MTPTPDGNFRQGFVPVSLADKENTIVPQSATFGNASVNYVQARKNLLGLSDQDDLELVAAEKGADGLNHARLHQKIGGVTVWNSDVVVHGSDNVFKSVSGNLTVGLKGFDLTPTVAATDALSLAKADYSLLDKTGADPSVLSFAKESTELVVYPSETLGVRLAWHVIFHTEIQNGVAPGRWNYFIDARDSRILEKFNALDTVVEASGPGGNAKVSRTWNANLDAETSGTQYQLNTTKYQTTNMNHGTTGTGTTVVGPLNPIGDAPEDDAHGFAEITVKMLFDWMGYNSIDNAGFKILSRVHYSTSYENAYWDGTEMTYGDGASTFYPLSGALDVVAHEIDHGFTEKHSNLTYSGMSGGDNESFSDIAGTIAEWYYDPSRANFDMGEDIFKSPTGALRYMCNPTQDGASIDNAANYNSGLDVHYSSGVMNKAFCVAAKRFSSGSPTGAATQDGVHAAGKAWYVANANYWTAGDSFTQACQGVYDAATSLGYSATQLQYIRDSWSDVGVFCGGATQPPPTCDETLTAATGSIQTPNYPAAYGNNYKHTWCIQPASGSAATLTFDHFDTESGYDFVTILGATGAQISKTSGATAPAPATSTKLYVTFQSDASVTKTGIHANWTSAGGTNQAPTVSITAPANGSTVSGMVTVSANAADADGTVAKVTFTLPDGTSVDDTTSPYSVTWNSATVADGAGKVITAKSTDNMGATSTTASVTVTVSNGGGGTCINGTFNATGLPMSIPDNNSTGITSNLAVTGNGTVGSMTLSAHITHTYQGDLVVTLIGPDGTSYTAWNRQGGSADNVVLTNVAVSTFNGKTAAGTWKLKVQDLAAVDTGTLDSWSLTIVGNCSGGGGGGNWSASGSPNLPTVDNGSACTSLTVTATGGNSADAKLDISGRHDYRSILRGTLAHNGTTVAAFPTGTFPSGAGTFSFTGRAVPGLSGDASGTWTFCIVDTDAFGDTGTLNTWSVHN